jgi:hypothetical protein
MKQSASTNDIVKAHLNYKTLISYFVIGVVSLSSGLFAVLQLKTTFPVIYLNWLAFALVIFLDLRARRFDRAAAFAGGQILVLLLLTVFAIALTKLLP